MWGRQGSLGLLFPPSAGHYWGLSTVSPFCCISLTCWEVFLHVLKNQFNNVFIFSQPCNDLVLYPAMTTITTLRDARCNAHFSWVCLENLSFSSLGLFLNSFHLAGKKIKDPISFECSEGKFPRSETHPSPPSPSSPSLNWEFWSFRV